MTDTTHITKEGLLQAISELEAVTVIDDYKGIAPWILARAAELESQAQPFAYTYCSCCKERIPAPAKWLLGYQLCDACIAAWKVSGSGVNITVQACHENPKLWDRPSQAQPVAVTEQQITDAWKAGKVVCDSLGVQAVAIMDDKERQIIRAMLETLAPAQAQPPADELSAQDASPKDGWQPIESAPCDDVLALLWSTDCGGQFEIIDLDHDSDPLYWKHRGYTHWHPLPKEPK